jgi:hypothetical protein
MCLECYRAARADNRRRYKENNLVRVRELGRLSQQRKRAIEEGRLKVCEASRRYAVKNGVLARNRWAEWNARNPDSRNVRVPLPLEDWMMSGRLFSQRPSVLSVWQLMLLERLEETERNFLQVSEEFGVHYNQVVLAVRRIREIVDIDWVRRCSERV